MSMIDLYRSKRRDAQEAVGCIRDGDRVIVPTGVAEPPTLLEALSSRRRDWRGVTVSQILAMRKYDYLDSTTSEHVRHVALFFGSATRADGQAGWIDFIPNCFSELPSMIERGHVGADIVLSMASPMDAHGYFSISLGADYTLAAIAKARAVVLEVNPNVPFAFGNCHVHISQVTALVESAQPVLEVGLPTIGPVQEAIAHHVADMIDDGATLQIGYGGIPDAVVMQLTDKHDLGVHTEMLGDGILSLIERGIVTNRRKTWMRGKSIATFALGSARLHRFHHRPAIDGGQRHPLAHRSDADCGHARQHQQERC